MLRRVRRPRRAAAVVELAILLPLLTFLFVIGTDFARVYNPAITIMNCARNGAMYGSQSPTQALDDTGIRAAALADAGDLSPPPTVAIRRFKDASEITYIEVSVSTQFKTVTRYPGVPSPLTLTRTVQMRVTPANPQGSTP
jgi:Flp pilus assembly protein TadG